MDCLYCSWIDENKRFAILNSGGLGFKQAILTKRVLSYAVVIQSKERQKKF